jgi:conjugal transfer ATP-binding protein TraC
MLLLNKLKDSATRSIAKVASFFEESCEVEADSLARAKARESLKVDMPTLKSALPYGVEQEGLFINQKSMGFGFELAPASGADESLMASFAEMLKTKLPNDVVAQFIFHKHGLIGDKLTHGFSHFLEKGGVYKMLAQKSIEFHANAIQQGYPNQANIPANLCDLRVYLYFSCANDESKKQRMHALRAAIIADLKVIGLSHLAMDKVMLASFLKSVVTPNLSHPFTPEVSEEIYHPDEPISNHCFEKGSSLTVFDNFIDADVCDTQGQSKKAVIVNCHLHKYPEQFALWQTPDLFANLYKAQKNISCPMLIAFAIHGQNQSKMRAKAKSNAYGLSQSNNGIQNFINPHFQEELRDWHCANDGLAKDDLALFPTLYNVVLFSDEDNASRHVSQAVSNYRDMGFELKPAKCLQWLRFLSSMPFMPSEGLWKGLNTLGETKTLTHFSAANLLPVVGDFKGSSKGVLFPTYRNQVAFLDAFDDKSFSLSNYNDVTYGIPGSGKSMKEQARILSDLALGRKVYIIDIGGSYKHLCEAVNGIYVDASTITLNPFTLFDFEGEIEIDDKMVSNYIQIRDLIAIMASPDKPLCDIQLEYLLQAVLATWKVKRNKGCVDDVVNQLKRMNKEDYTDDRRLSDLILLLMKFTKGGLYYNTFSGDTPSFTKNQMVVFELGELARKDKHLLKIVMYVMIVIIQGEFYNTPRSVYKRCIIDEAWKILKEGDNQSAANFINQGFRTARKHNGGFSVIVHSLFDMEHNAQTRAIKACANVEYIMLQGDLNKYVQQNPDEFNEQQIRLLRDFGEAGSQGFASMMVQYGKGYAFHRYFADPYSRILFSTKGHEFDAVEALVNSGVSIEQAVHQVAQHTFDEAA